jgi:4-hydroxybenzoate polyprenyltransferase/phosphoserine phosphatase
MSVERLAPASPISFAPPLHPAADAARRVDERERELPLVVDVDGTLLRGDLLWDGLVQLCVRRPAELPALLRAAGRGRAAIKAFVAASSGVAADAMPLEPATLALIEAARSHGRPVILASGAHASQVAALGARVRADATWGSDDVESLTGEAKLRRIRAHYDAFDYVGDGAADLPLWGAARRAYAVNAGWSVRWRARRLRPDLVVVPTGIAPWHSLMRAMRPHQWVKNALLLLPALAAHLAWTADHVLRLAAGSLAFCLLASAVYLVNDVIDAPHDRLHHGKRRRPIASGELSVPAALVAALGLVGLAAVLAAGLSPGFQLVLAGYLATTTAYSLALKRQPLVDVIVLAMLYTTRLAAGAALVSVPLSRWFLAFSIFFFLSLALAKRALEMREGASVIATSAPRAAARGYIAADLPFLVSLGVSSAVASSLVYGLYITDGAVAELYGRPDLLWLGLPILLYWQARVWLRTSRGEMHHDPVVFALRDRTSYALFAVFLLVVALAS